MQPTDLYADSFARYPPRARSLAVTSVAVLRRIPLALLPLFLCQLISYDGLFPPEQRDLEQQFNYLGTVTTSQFNALMESLATIRLPPEISESDWVNQPKHFAEQLSAFLWSVHQGDHYHNAARAYQQHVEAVFVREPPETSRYTIVKVGAGVSETNLRLFRRLRRTAPSSPVLTRPPVEATIGPASRINVVSYAKLAPVVRKELTLLDEFEARPLGKDAIRAEAVTSYMADMKPKDLGLGNSADNPVLQHFELDALTEGPVTQVFSTTFVQGASRECLHRTQPLTLLARFRPRQEAGTMNQLLSRDPFNQVTDLEGALVDADMGAYYAWISQSRLSGGDRSRFIVWFEDHSTAITIGPSMARGATSDVPTDMAKILA